MTAVSDRAVSLAEQIEACERANRWMRDGDRHGNEMTVADVDIMRAGLRAAAQTLRELRDDLKPRLCMVCGYEHPRTSRHIGDRHD